jgi:predicted dehydrogenase
MLGFGSVGKVPAPAYREIPSLHPSVHGYHLAAVCTNSPETTRAASKEGGFAYGCSRIRDLMADPNVTAVDCVLPDHAHKPAILECLAAGKPVYCEKPLALSSEEQCELAATARRHNTTRGMTFNYRFFPAVLKAMELCQDSALGEILSFHFEYLHSGYQDATRPLPWRMRRETSGGSARVDLGSHAIDLTRYLQGRSVFRKQRTRRK